MTDKLQIISPKEAATGALKTFLDEDFPVINDTTESMTVKNPESYAIAGDWRKRVTDAMKAIETRRKAIVEPLNKEVKAVNDTFKLATGAFEGLLTRLDGKMIPFAMEQQRAREEAAERAKAAELRRMEEQQKMVEDAAVATGNETLLDMAVGIETEKAVIADRDIKVSKSTRGEEASTTIKKRWLYRVTDLTKVDRAFLMIDDKAVKAAMSKNEETLKEGKLEIAGLEFYSEVSLSSRGI